MNTPGISQVPELSVNSGHFSPILSSAFSNKGDRLATVDESGIIIVWDLKTGRQVKKFEGEGVQLLCFTEGDSILYGGSNHSIFQYNISNPGTQRFSSIEPTLNFTTKDPCLFLEKRGNLIIAAFKNKLLIQDKASKIRELNIPEPGYAGWDSTRVVLTISEDQKMLVRSAIGFKGKHREVYLYFQIFQLDLASGNISKIQEIKAPAWESYPRDLRISEHGKFLFLEGNYGELHVSKADQKGTFSTFKRILFPGATNSGGVEKVNKFYPSEKFLGSDFICTSYDQDILITDFKGSKIHFLPQLPERVTHFSLSHDKKTLFCCTISNELFLFDIPNRKLIRKIRTQKNWGTALFIPDDGKTIFIGYTGGIIKRWDLKSNEVQVVNVRKNNKIFSQVNSIDFISKIHRVKNDSIVIFSYESTTKFKGESLNCEWNFRTGKIKSEIIRRIRTPDHLTHLHNEIKKKLDSIPQLKRIDDDLLYLNNLPFRNKPGERISDIQKIGNSDWYAVLYLSGKITFHNHGAENESMELGILGNEGFYYFLTNSNYYFASKEAIQRLSFRVGQKVCGVDQFDILYNRPDLIMKSFPFIDTNLIELYGAIYQKRISRDGNKIINSNDIPVIAITEKLPFESETNLITVSASAIAKESPIEELICFSNGVQVAKISHIHKMEYNGKISFQLSPGINSIELVAINERKIKSLPEEFDISYRGKENSTQFIVCIGSGKFKESKNDLKYASKDAIDISKYFTGRKNTKVLTLVDEQVTAEACRTIETFISTARVNDKIMMFYSGHGLLDEEFNYYLSASEVSFSNPKNGGIPYDSLIAVLQKNPCRQKALFLDACHSGEMDKEVAVISTKTESKEEVIVFRSTNSLTYTGNAQTKNAFELSRILFADLDRSGGVSVISSAGGLEYALEGEKWKNGVFTYAFLIGVKEKKADYNGDGMIRLSEIQKFLAQKVSQLTNGQQTPSRRTENLKNDFIIE